MAHAAPTSMSVDEFLDWASTQPGRYELELGAIIAMRLESPGHVRFQTTIQHALAAAIRHAKLGCETVGGGVMVRVDGTTAYEPDALVYSGARQPARMLVVDDPVIVVEAVWSQSEVGGRGGRLIGYFFLPSILHYLIVDAERRTLIHHARRSGEIATRILYGGPLRLDPPGLDVRIEDLFGEPPEA